MKQVAEKMQNGEMSSEEGSPSMPREVYMWLSERALLTGNAFAHAFCTLEWNLISRGVTTAAVRNHYRSQNLAN